MQIGIIGLGRMGGNIARRLMRDGHTCVVFDAHAPATEALTHDGATAAASIADMVQKLQPPRAVWSMLPSGKITEDTIAALGGLLGHGDTIIDGGNTYYRDDIRRAAALAPKGIRYIDVGTSGGVWGLERGYCMMIGGDRDAFEQLDPVFKTLAPGRGDIPETPGRDGLDARAEEGYLYCGAAGAGHFVKMVHNGIEYGMMAALAEGLNILRHADAGAATQAADAETAPLRHPERYRYDFDIGAIAEVWRRGSVVSSWLLDLAAAALLKSPGLDGFAGRVSDSGEGRWTLQAAIDEGVPAPVLATALFARFGSRGEADYADRVLSALRFGFGGHLEKPAATPAQH